MATIRTPLSRHLPETTPAPIAFGAAALLLVAALVFGGGSRGTGDFLVHLVALPALVLALLRWRHADATRLQRLLLWWWLAALAVVALQLLPLPAAVFARLPQREQVLADLHTAGLAPDWLPMSLDRWGTVRALLSLATFGAMWMLACTLTAEARQRLIKLAIVISVPLVLLGFAQVAGGRHVDLQFHPYQNVGSATGSFANRNHFASLLAMLGPFAILAGYQAQRARQPGWCFAWYSAAVLMLLGAAMTFSRAGVILASSAAALTVGLVLRDNLLQSHAKDGRRGRMALYATLGVTVLAVANYAWSEIADRFDTDPLGDRRWEYLEHGLAAIRSYLPWGSGAGSFPYVYAPFEPLDAMVHTYALHAHNELAEVALELGLPGLLLVVGLLLLVIAATSKALSAIPGSHAISGPVTAIAVWVPLVHSLVDYPLRTLAVTVVFALLLAQLTADRDTPPRS